MRNLETDKKFISALADSVGITINGPRPEDIQIHNENLYTRILEEGSCGLGEAYIERWWDCERLDLFFEKILSARLDRKVNIPFRYKLRKLLASKINLQNKNRAKQVALRHYDLGNELF